MTKAIPSGQQQYGSGYAQQILKDAIQSAVIRKFEIKEPSLNDIFIRIASPERKEDNHE